MYKSRDFSAMPILADAFKTLVAKTKTSSTTAAMRACRTFAVVGSLIYYAGRNSEPGISRRRVWDTESSINTRGLSVSNLPIKRVVLYKHGVGYFERETQIEGDQSLSISFKQREVSDVLKSPTVLDLNGGMVSAVSYDSTTPIEQLPRGNRALHSR